jgi:hypothetical protein
MERLLVIKLDALDCDAEARINGIPVARAHPGRPRIVVPVHEYTLAGSNRLELVIWPRPNQPAGAPLPPPQMRLGDGRRSATVRILLPRVGGPADESSARSLGQLDWAAAEGVPYEAPLTLVLDVTIPVSFPRWRWMDAPLAEATPALHALALSTVQALAQDLAAGETDRFLHALRLRTEELASAYQRRPEDDVQRWRTRLSTLQEQGALKWPAWTPEGFILRPLAGGRLLECLDASGQAALRTEPDAQGQVWSFPLRLAALENRVYVLR